MFRSKWISEHNYIIRRDYFMDIEMMKKHSVQMILQFSIPSIIAMVMTSMITVVDGFFIGNYVGKEGMAAVNLGLPLIYLFLAVGLMFSVGGVAIAGMTFGAGDLPKCRKVFCQTVVTTTVVSCILSILTFFFFHPMMQILHADGLVRTYFEVYYKILLFELPVMVVNSCFGMFIRGDGNPQYFMKINVCNVLLNIVLDAVFTKGLHWGVAGIAAASLISAVVTLFLSIRYFTAKAKGYRFCRFSFDKEVFRNTVFNGSSEFIGEMSMAISMFAYNLVIMRRIGSDGVTAFTIVGYIAYIFSMILIGFGQGSSSLISFSYGAKEEKLAASIRQRTNLFVFFSGVAVILLMTLLSGWYGSLFVKDGMVQEMVHSGIPIYIVSFLFSGINTITSFYFTSIGKAKESAIISSSRGLVVLLICIFVLPMLFGMTGVWLAAPVTEGITILLSILFLTQEKRAAIA